jgi:hypothetical protein
MDCDTLDSLEQSGAIPGLLPFLSSQIPEQQNQVLLTMFYLCQIKASRQERAAQCGIIPHLQRFVRADHPMKQFAYPMLFNLAKASRISRAEVKKYAGVAFYIEVLRDFYWRSHALEVLSVWLADEPARVGFILQSPSHLNALLSVFLTTSNNTQFEAMLPLFRNILGTSLRVNQSLGKSPIFLTELRRRFDRHAQSNAIRLNLLKILGLILAIHEDRANVLHNYQLDDTLRQLSEDKDSVLVASLAMKMLEKTK